MNISKSDLKKFSSLKNKSKRYEYGYFVVEGLKNCVELVNSEIKIREIFISNDYLLTEFPNAKVVTSKELKRISQLKTPSEVLAIANIPERSKIDINSKVILYLEDIKDPGNLGTIIRTLDWFGYTQLFCSEETVDNFNSKVIMASMGSIFRVNVIYLKFENLLKYFSDYNIYGTYVNENNIHDKIIKQKSIIVMGNESKGISDSLSTHINNRVSIPKFGRAESLNVSTAAGIILNEINRNY